MFITVVNLFIFRYYSQIISVFIKLLLGKTVNLWKGLVCGFGLGFICLTDIGAFFFFYSRICAEPDRTAIAICNG